MLEKLQKFKADIIALGIVVLAALREIYAVLTVADIADICIDDFYYLSADSANPEYSPLYITLLNLLEKVVGFTNALFTYQVIVFIVLPFALYSLLRIRQRSPLVATAITLLVLQSSISHASSGWPLVGTFAIITGLLWMACTEQLRQWWNVWLLHATGALMLMYVRPEYLLSFALFAILAIFTLRRTLTAPNITLIVGLVIIISLVVTQIGLPIGKGRFDHAFMQHFSVNGMVFNRYGPLGNTDPWTAYPTFIQISFGEATTFWAAVAANPHAVAAHIGMNVVRFPIALVRTLYLTNPAGFWFFNAVAVSGLCIGIVRAKAIVVDASVSSIQPWHRRLLGAFADRLTMDRVWIISSAVYLLPFLLSMIIIYPRIHYFGIVFVWALLALFGGMQWRHPPQQSERPSITWQWLLVYSGIVLIIYPNPADHYAYPDGSRPNLRVIQAIQSLEIPPSQIGMVAESVHPVGYVLGAHSLNSLQSPEAQKLMSQLRVLIIPRSSTEPVDLTRFRPLRIENQVFQVFMDSDLCRPELCFP